MTERYRPRKYLVNKHQVILGNPSNLKISNLISNIPSLTSQILHLKNAHGS